MTTIYDAHLWIDLREELTDKEISSFSLGYDGKLYILTTYTKDNVQYRTPNGMFAKLRSDKPNNFIVYIADSKQVEEYIIPKQKWNYHNIQPLPNDELLLLCGRTNKRSKENANIFSLDGVIKRSFTLGDAIEAVQTTSTGEIWTSYFDEGFDQSFGDIDITGLHRWDKDGKELYRYYPFGGLNILMDCYAMNLESNTTVWIYYYTDFPLVKIVDDQISDYWHPPTKGSHNFAIYGNHIVFIGSYDDKLFHHYELLPNHKIKHIQTFDFNQAGWYTTRGKTIIISEDNQFYRFDIPELLRKRN